MKAAEEMKREELPNETPRKDMMREALKYYEELAAIARRHRSDIPEAIRAYYASPSSATAEEIPTAKEFVNKYYNLPQSKVMTVRIGSLIKCLERFAALKNNPQPTAEGAEEILRRMVGETENGFKRDFAWFSEAINAMHEFAALHAQKIADKMVEWISVEDKLPEEHEDVLCYNGHRISSHNWCKYTDQDDEWFKKTFTHWCKLPKIPKP